MTKVYFLFVTTEKDPNVAIADMERTGQIAVMGDGIIPFLKEQDAPYDIIGTPFERMMGHTMVCLSVDGTYMNMFRLKTDRMLTAFALESLDELLS